MPLHRLFSWLSGLFGMFVIFYGFIALPQAWRRAASGSDQGLPEVQPDMMTELHHIYHIFWHTRLVPACVLLILAGLVILMLTFPRKPKLKPTK